MAIFFLLSHTILLVFIFFTNSLVAAQLPTNGGMNFSCPVDSPPSCDTYVSSRAQSPTYESGEYIRCIWISPLSIARASNLSDEDSKLIPGQLIMVPVTCGCSRNRSFANITYGIKAGDSFYLVSNTAFESLMNWHVAEEFNPQ